MTDRDRLIELCNEKIKTMTFVNSDHWYDFQEKISQMVNYLLANGVIVPPCKVGDIVYTIFEGDIEALKITYTKTEESMESIRKYYDAENKFLKMPFADCHIGKSIFLTKEKAEKALVERSKGK